MSPSGKTPSLSIHRIIALTVFVFLSLALPAGIVCWSVKTAMTGKPFGRTSNEHKFYQGTVKDGELWFSVMRVKGTVPTVRFDCVIKRLNLETGVECDTGIDIADEQGGGAIWLKNELYMYTDPMIYKRVGNSLQKFAPTPPLSAEVQALPFLYQDQLTTIIETDGGEFRLIHWTDGQWVNGRKILLPRSGRVWVDDANRDRKVLLPLTSQQPGPPGTGTPLYLRVVNMDDDFHLFLTDIVGFAAYRNGFEFDDDRHDETSALAPENAAHEVSGWEMIQPTKDGDAFSGMGNDKGGLLFYSWKNRARVVRRHPDGRWESVTESDGRDSIGMPYVPVGESDSANYIVEEIQQWNSAKVFRIEGNTIQPAHIILRGAVPEYFKRWQYLLLGLLLAWLLHLTLLFCGTALLTYNASHSGYHFGTQQVALASTSRRAVAWIIDLVFVLIVLFSLVYLQSRSFGVDWKSWIETHLTEKELCVLLFDGENAIDYGLNRGTIVSAIDIFRQSLDSFLSPLRLGQTILIIGIIEALFLFCLKLYFEGRFGITPGKWLIGLRTVQSTLRPCGFARALVRNVLYWVDILFLVTPIPAAVSMMFSTHNQRLGDRITDTIVIRNRSTHEKDE